MGSKDKGGANTKKQAQHKRRQEAHTQESEQQIDGGRKQEQMEALAVLDRAGMLQLDHLRQRAVVTADPWLDPAVGYPIRFEHHPASRTSPPPALD